MHVVEMQDDKSILARDGTTRQEQKQEQQGYGSQRHGTNFFPVGESGERIAEQFPPE